MSQKTQHQINVEQYDRVLKQQQEQSELQQQQQRNQQQYQEQQQAAQRVYEQQQERQREANKMYQRRIDAAARETRERFSQLEPIDSQEQYKHEKSKLDIAIELERAERSAHAQEQEKEALERYRAAGMLKTPEHYNCAGRDRLDTFEREEAAFERRQQQLNATIQHADLPDVERQRAELVRDAEYHAHRADRAQRIIDYEKMSAGFTNQKRQENQYDEQYQYHSNAAAHAAAKLEKYDLDHGLIQAPGRELEGQSIDLERAKKVAAELQSIPSLTSNREQTLEQEQGVDHER